MGRYLVVAGLAVALGFAAGWLVRGRDIPATTATAAEGATDLDPAGAGPHGSRAPTGDPDDRTDRAGGAASAAADRSAAARAAAAADPRATAGAPAAAFDAAAARQALRIAQLEQQLRDAEERLAEVQRTGRPSEALAGRTAAERRAEAARNGEMLVEFPHWGEELGLTAEQAAEHGVSDAERETLDRMYRDFYTRAMSELKRLYRELTGDPTAGETSSLNALLHDVLELSPQGPCRDRMALALQLLAAGQPLPPPAADAPPCETAVWFLFQAVDALERAAGELGPAAHDALWSGRSTFMFSGRSDDDDDD
jgi:hypothetical protein